MAQGRITAGVAGLVLAAATLVAAPAAQAASERVAGVVCYEFRAPMSEVEAFACHDQVSECTSSPPITLSIGNDTGRTLRVYRGTGCAESNFYRSIDNHRMVNVERSGQYSVRAV